MGNPIKKMIDILSIEKEIAERQRLVSAFHDTGILNRGEAINAIISLQSTDFEVAIATRVKQGETGAVNLEYADNRVIISNLQFQIDFLNAKLAVLNAQAVAEKKKDK